jgi:hypothetical protein
VSEIGDAVRGIERWWETLLPARKQIEGLLGSRTWSSYAHWLRADTSLRQWVISMAPGQSWPPVSVRTIPPLVVLEWNVRLRPPPDPYLQAFIWTNLGRKSNYERLSLARQVYRTTLRLLDSAISIAFPFSDAEYRRCLTVPPMDLVLHPAGCNLHLLALAVLRTNYETFCSIFDGVPDEASLDETVVSYPFGWEFAERVRICWRAQFVAEYASIYWLLVAMRDGRRGVSKLDSRAAALYTADIYGRHTDGESIRGRVAFPAVDGLPLGLFL